MCTPDNGFSYSSLEGKGKFRPQEKPLTLLDRIFSANAANLEVQDPYGIPGIENHPAAIALKQELETCC